MVVVVGVVDGEQVLLQEEQKSAQCYLKIKTRREIITVWSVIFSLMIIILQAH
jgi:hypothetical protein